MQANDIMQETMRVISCKAMTKILYRNSEKSSRTRNKWLEEKSSGTFSARIFSCLYYYLYKLHDVDVISINKALTKESKKTKTKVVYHLLGKTGWSTVVVNGTRRILNGNFHGDAFVPFPRLVLGRYDQRRSKSKGLELVKTTKWNAHFPFRFVYHPRNPFFPRKFPFGEKKLMGAFHSTKNS